jgi:UDP-glucose 4-epimerase
MRILVTGASGFVGRALCPALTQAGHEVIRAMRRDDGGPGALVCGDLGSDCAWFDRAGPVEVVIHLAARVHQMYERPDEAEHLHQVANVDATLALAVRASEHGVRRFIFISSVKVNGEGRPTAYRADDAPAPVDAYGRSKAAAEAGLFRLAAMSNLELVVIRPPMVYGPGVGGNFATLIRALQRGLPLPLASITGNRRSLVGVDNLVSLILLCASHPEASGRVWMCSDGDDVSTAELLSRLAGALGLKVNLLRFPPALLRLLGALTGRGAAVRRLCGDLTVDIGPTRDLLGWTPPVPLDEGLRSCRPPRRPGEVPAC